MFSCDIMKDSNDAIVRRVDQFLNLRAKPVQRGEPVLVVAPHCVVALKDPDVVWRALDGTPVDLWVPIRDHAIETTIEGP
jgi:hypothetical protein